MKSTIGIDPGMSGALSYYDGQELLVYDMPTFTVPKNGVNRKVVDVRGLKKILEEIPYGLYKPHVYIEQISAQPGNGAAGAFTYGEGYGALKTVITLMDFAHTFVSPQKWKKAMGCTKDKNTSRLIASQRLPKFSCNWDLKKHDGRAESALIALYGYNL